MAYALRVRRVRNRYELDAKVEEALRSAALWNEVKDRLEWPAYNLSGSSNGASQVPQFARKNRASVTRRG